jgi:hypothetical protein
MISTLWLLGEKVGGKLITTEIKTNKPPAQGLMISYCVVSPDSKEQLLQIILECQIISAMLTSAFCTKSTAHGHIQIFLPCGRFDLLAISCFDLNDHRTTFVTIGPP